jgi:hypothetical protein
MATRTIIPAGPPNASALLGRSLGSALQGLLEHKVGELTRAREKKLDTEALEGMGYSPAQIKYVLRARPEDRYKLLLDRGLRPENARQPESPSEMGNVIPNRQEPQPEQNGQSLQSLFGGGQQQGMGGQQNAIVQNLLRALQPPSAQQPQQSQQPPAQQPTQQMNQPQPRQRPQAFQGLQGMVDPRMEQTERLANEARAASEKRHVENLSNSEKRHAEKLHHKEISQISDKARSAKRQIKELDTLKQLNDTGKLVQGPGRKLLEKYGLEDFITNTETQVAAKIIEQNNLEALSASQSGGRPTDAWRSAIAKSNARLTNTKEAFNEILQQKRVFKEMDEAEGQAQSEVLQKYANSGKPLPINIRDEIDKAAQPKIDKIAEKDLMRIRTETIKDTAIPIDVKDLPDPKTHSKETYYDPAKEEVWYVRNGKWSRRAPTVEDFA